MARCQTDVRFGSKNGHRSSGALMSANAKADIRQLFVGASHANYKWSGPRSQTASASRIRLVIASGCEISDRWLDLTSIVFAPMRLAMKRSRSGLIVRSSVETAYQLGFDRQAACVVLPASRALWNGHWTA